MLPQRARAATGVVEGHQDVERRLLLRAPFAVDDVKGHSFSLGDVVTHAARGVDDETERGGLGEAHEPAAAEEGFMWEGCVRRGGPTPPELLLPGSSLQEAPVSKDNSEILQQLHGSEYSQFSCLEVVRAVAGAQRVLIDAPRWVAPARPVK